MSPTAREALADPSEVQQRARRLLARFPSRSTTSPSAGVCEFSRRPPHAAECLASVCLHIPGGVRTINWLANAAPQALLAVPFDVAWTPRITCRPRPCPPPTASVPTMRGLRPASIARNARCGWRSPPPRHRQRAATRPPPRRLRVAEPLQQELGACNTRTYTEKSSAARWWQRPDHPASRSNPVWDSRSSMDRRRRHRRDRQEADMKRLLRSMPRRPG